ncbi:MAG: helix-turn-helix domain-containing protein [Candidatus Nanopelagicales bacterium]
MDKLAYTVQEAAAACGVSVETIRRAIRAKDLPVNSPNSRPLITRAALEAWIDAWPAVERKAAAS